MSTSYSETGEPVFGTPPIERIQEGMKVIDLNGDDLGKVEYIQMGDPQAATTEGNDLPEPGLLGRVAIAFAGDEREPEVHEPLRSQLLRIGFIKVDGGGLLAEDRYVRSDQIARVSGDTVTLSISKHRLAKEE
jgi:hypothetical protein